jgi:hypothetical protein
VFDQVPAQRRSSTFETLEKPDGFRTGHIRAYGFRNCILVGHRRFAVAPRDGAALSRKWASELHRLAEWIDVKDELPKRRKPAKKSHGKSRAVRKLKAR